jgi:hypothetical protein
MADQRPPARFEPLATCPKTKRGRYAARAARAHVGFRAAVELKCLDCVSWERPEATRCQIRTCALWAANRSIFGVPEEADGQDEEATHA